MNETVSDILQTEIFPNPSTGNINIKLNEFGSQLTVEFFNLLGEKVTTYNFSLENNRSVKIENISEGVYIIKLTIDGYKQSNHRVVIAK